MTVEWYEWVQNEMNDLEMMWMTAIWYEYIKIEMNDCQMISMSQEWDEWLLNDVNDTDFFPLMGAESRGTQEVVQAILGHSETDD